MANSRKYTPVSLPIEFLEKVKNDALIRQKKQNRPIVPSMAEMIVSNYQEESDE